MNGRTFKNFWRICTHRFPVLPPVVSLFTVNLSRPLHRSTPPLCIPNVCTPARRSTRTERARLRCRRAYLPGASTRAPASLHPRCWRPPVAPPPAMSALLPGTARKTKPRFRRATMVSRQTRRATCLQQASSLVAAVAAAATMAAITPPLAGRACPCGSRAFGGVFDRRMPLRDVLPRPLLPRGAALPSAGAAAATAAAKPTKTTRWVRPTRGERSMRIPA